jgi:hypothetical protein
VDDFVINVRQIAQYAQSEFAQPTDLALVQSSGLGGPYKSVSAWAFVQGAAGIVIPPDNSGAGFISAYLASPLFGPIGWNFYANQQGGQSTLRNGAAGAFSFDGTTLSFIVSPPGIRGQPIPSWTAALSLSGDELSIAGSVTVGRSPCAPMEVATAQYVTDAVQRAFQLVVDNSVWRFNGRRGDVNLTITDIQCAGGAPLLSPGFCGCPTAPAIEDPDRFDFQIANTAFVQTVINHRINQLLIGHPFVWSFNGRTGNICLNLGDILGAGGAPIDSPNFTGTPSAPTAAASTDTDQIATTAFVQSQVTSIEFDIANLRLQLEQEIDDSQASTLAFVAETYAPLASPNFTGYATAPTAPPGSADGQIATTAFVMNAVAASTAGVATFNSRTGAVVFLPADLASVNGATLASPAFTGIPSAPTAATGTNTTQLATTAFVLSEITAIEAGVLTFNGRSGTVTLTLADITGTGGAPLASPALSGTPSAPTASTGTNTTQLATTAFVQAAVAAVTAGVTSFNGRTGAIALIANDVSAAGGALLASPAFTGAPTAPTAGLGTSTTQLATTAFVMSALAAAAGVDSFNGRTGAVTLTTADVTAVMPAVVTSFNTRIGAVTLQGSDFSPLAWAFDANQSPPATTSSTNLMRGLGAIWTITPTLTGRVLVTVAGSVQGTVVSSPALRLYYGTGTAPAAGAAIAGTNIGGTRTGTISGASYQVPFSFTAVVGSLVVGTAVWFDLSLSTNGGSAQINLVDFSAVEF